MKRIRSVDYLNFIGQHHCVITGKHPVDCHHESVVRGFMGQQKKYFDYGAIPLDHDIHINERHALGRHGFWTKYDMNPRSVVASLIREYLTTEPEDFDEAQRALRMVSDGA